MTEPSVLISKQGKVVGSPSATRDTHVCIICENPVAQHARLVPCLHTFCRSCAAQMQSCTLCHSAIETVELLNSLTQKLHISALTLQCYDSALLATDPAVGYVMPCASQASPQYTKKARLCVNPRTSRATAATGPCRCGANGCAYKTCLENHFQDCPCDGPNREEPVGVVPPVAGKVSRPRRGQHATQECCTRH